MRVKGRRREIIAVTCSELPGLSPTGFGGYLSNTEGKTGEDIRDWGLQ